MTTTTHKRASRRGELIDRITREVRQLTILPTPVRARIQNIQVDEKDKAVKLHINSEWSQRDLTRMEKSTFAKDYFVDLTLLPRVGESKNQNDTVTNTVKDEGSDKLRANKTNIDILPRAYVTSVVNPGNSECKTTCYGGAGLRAFITSYKPSEDDTAADKSEQELLEIWSSQGKLASINLSKSKKHGKVYTDAEFGAFHFSPEARDPHILYVAEKFADKSDSFYDERRENVEPGEKGSQPPGRTVGEQSAFREDWGEQMREKSQPILAVVDFEGSSISVLENTRTDLSCGQPVWTPDASGVVFVGVKHEPRRLGIVYCSNRECALFYLKLDASVDAIALTPEHERSVKAPRFSPDGKTLVFLERAAGGPHNAGFQLKKIIWPPVANSSSSVQSAATFGAVVVDLVNSVNGKRSMFPGLYPAHNSYLPRRCFSADSKYLFLSTAWRSRVEIIGIDINTGRVLRLTNDDQFPCYHLHDIYGSYMVATRSSPSSPPMFVVAELPDDLQGAEDVHLLEWYPLDEQLSTDEPAPDWEIIPLDIQNGGGNDMEIICIKSPFAVDPCVILCPHGGPHAVFSADFYWSFVAMSRLEANIVLVNYRGSVGFGENNLNSLLGHIGDHDVDDCMRALDYVVGKRNWPKEKICLYGGSHGGFLVTSLIGQHPDLFAACATRNPVTNLASMISATDIPDWAIVEAENPKRFVYDGRTMPNLQKLYKCSPIANIQKVRTPTLLALGTDDARVPPFQGTEYYQALRAHGVPCKLLTYKKNCHPIDKVNAETDFFVHLMLWFKQWTEETRPQFAAVGACLLCYINYVPYVMGTTGHGKIRSPAF